MPMPVGVDSALIYRGQRSGLVQKQPVTLQFSPQPLLNRPYSLTVLITSYQLININNSLSVLI